LDIRAKRSVRLFLFGHGAVPKIFWSALGGRAEYIFVTKNKRNNGCEIDK